MTSERRAAREGVRFEFRAHLMLAPVRMSTSRASGEGEAPSPDKPAHIARRSRRESRDLPARRRLALRRRGKTTFWRTL